MTGKTLGHYQVASRIGKGGMGEVYQAKDQKLGRDVAIKVLPEEFARDADRVARFQREAKLLASLNHPNIAAIYGLEESGGTNFLVLELVEGETLADRIKRGPVPVEEALKLALQIVEALEAAHEKGVIHRDLKPANIKVTPDGMAKVLDFGLAKAYVGEKEQADISNSPTLSDMATQQGVILGTAAYMSPEQARGKPVDKRADIWAFGCVLYEMLAGRAAFGGSDATDILAAVIRADPEWKRLPANLHWRLRELLERCLMKEARDRYDGINDARVEIRKVMADPGGVWAQPIAGTKPLRKFWIAAALLLGASIAGTAVWKLKPGETRPPVRFAFETSYGRRFSNIGIGNVLAASPDGARLVYATTAGLCMRSFDRLDDHLVAGTQGDVSSPCFSPDGRWIGYWSFSENKLMKVAVDGGTPLPLTDDRPLGSLTWSAENEILYSGMKGIMRISANGGKPETLIEAKDEIYFDPWLLPDGKSMLLTVDTKDGSAVAVQSLDSGERRLLFAGTKAQYFPTGHLVFIRNHGLWAVPFSLDKLQPTGGEVSMVQGIYQLGAPQCAISDSGTLVYLPRLVAKGNRRLVWIHSSGIEEKLQTPPRTYSNPSISPDGTRVAVQTDNEQIEIWDLVRENISPLTADDRVHLFPLWTPDGRWIVFTGTSGGASAGIYRKPSDGAGVVECLHLQKGWQLFATSWTSGGKSLVGFRQRPAIREQDIGTLQMEDNRAWRPLLQESHIETNPKMSPDGQFLAYESEESGQREVYIRSFPDVDRERFKVSTDGGNTPLWSQDGRELFYRSGDLIMAVALETKPKLRAAKPRALFHGKYFSSLGHQWDIHPDGKRFLMIKEPEFSETESASAGPSPKIIVVLNWLEELKQRAPVK